MNDENRNDWAPPPPAPMSPNPYAAPQAEITPTSGQAIDNAEQIRRELLNHEASLRSVGFLYLLGAYLGGFFTLIMMVALVIVPFTQDGSSEPGMGIGLGFMAIFGVIYGFLAFISYYLGKGLRALDPKVRTGVTILSAIGLLGFPLGTLINGYILYLLHSEKGKRIMTPEYQAIVAQTPHIKYRTPTWLVVLIVLVIVSVAAAIIIGIMGA